jgi:transposase
VLGLVQTLNTLAGELKALERQLDDAVRTHPDGEIFLSLFKDPNSFITAAELLAEIGDCRARYPSRDALAGDAGQAAVAIESGKRKTASFRWGATSACAPRSPDWRTPRGTGIRGRRTYTPPPASAAMTTRARYAR